ncbi:MAG: DUF4256 domain-containing protein [Acholeplasmataceae bacterium]|nr:DUF4256 domain-containing protein [Acholeplasmataceae bacterium]
MKKRINELTVNETEEFIILLKTRFEKNMNRHLELSWAEIAMKLISEPNKLFSLYEMEKTGGEPDVVGFNQKTAEFIFIDCSKETPAGRRNVCYDREALDSRKEFKPTSSAIDMANEMGIDLLTEEDYRYLQSLEKFDLKTSSWVKTPEKIRKLGGALFCDCRYDQVFLYHNGASSYYGVRGFRGLLKV